MFIIIFTSYNIVIGILFMNEGDLYEMFQKNIMQYNDFQLLY